MVTVYTKPNCTLCRGVKKFFDHNNLTYQELPIDEDVLNLARLKNWKSAPIVLSDTHPELSFCGFPRNEARNFVEAHTEN